MINCLCVIPARGGSKGVKNKNIRLLNKKPLIEYTIKEAQKIKSITDLIVSTDSRKIQKISNKLGVKTPFLRPKKLSTDKALTYPVILHALFFMENLNNKKYDYILVLQPTTPFRNANHIKKSLELIKKSKYDSVVSLVDVGANHPLRMKTIINNKLKNYVNQGFWNMKPRQKLPKVYIRNGCIYLIKRDIFIKEKSMIGNNCFGMVMSSKESINIDTEIDFKIAESIISEK